MERHIYVYKTVCAAGKFETIKIIEYFFSFVIFKEIDQLKIHDQ